jgi:hypothetical protein
MARQQRVRRVVGTTRPMKVFGVLESVLYLIPVSAVLGAGLSGDKLNKHLTNGYFYCSNGYAE